MRSQDYPNLEHIVIDGAFPDGTRELLESRDSEVDYWRSEPDAGMADGFNRGVQHACGDAVLFMNAGDLFHASDSLSKLVAGVSGSLRQRIVYGDALVAGADEEFRQRTDHRRLDRRISLCHQAALIGIELAREFPYDNRLIVDSDYDFWLRCRECHGVEIFVKVDLIVCRYELGGASNAPGWAEHNFISNHVSRLLNNGRRKHRLSDLIVLPVSQILEYRVKRAMRSLLGTRTYLTVKRWLGR